MPGIKGMNKGNKNRGAGGRIRLDLSLADTAKHKRLTFFREMARDQLRHEPTDKEIIDVARDWYYRQDEKVRTRNMID